MILASTLVSDVKEKFEGGNALAVNWDTVIKSAMENALDAGVRPEPLSRVAPIYGGLAQDLKVYHCPADMLEPEFLYLNDGLPTSAAEKRKLRYQPPADFFKKLAADKFTIQYINGVRFILTTENTTESILTIDAMEALGTKTGGSAALNEHNFLLGSASIQAAFTDAGVTLSDTLSSTIDISEYLKGMVILPTYITDTTKLSSLVIRLLSSAGNYYQVSISDISSYLINGWNMLQFNMANATTSGTPVSTAIASWQIIGTTTSGQTLTLIFDKFTIQKTNPFYLEYYSNRPYVSAAGAYWQSSCVQASGDYLNIDRDTYGILLYEACMEVVQNASFDNVDSQESKRFERKLAKKYEDYWAIHPSNAMPLSYSKSPEIDMGIDNSALARLQDDTEPID